MMTNTLAKTKDDAIAAITAQYADCSLTYEDALADLEALGIDEDFGDEILAKGYENALAEQAETV